ncbi:MAG: aconitase family protein, partial [Mycobacterium sp.]
PGLTSLTAMDRHVIANMGAELGATTTVFPSDDAVRGFLRAEGREDDWVELAADDGAGYDVEETIDLSKIEPLIAKPSSPGNVVPVREVAGEPVAQVVIGSSANPGLRDFAIAAAMVDGRQTPPDVSFDVNPTSREILTDLTMMGATASLVIAGARIHQAGCMGCIGMGQAPATGHNSLRTMPRNFPGRSGTREDKVWLCSPETAAASALTGVITDPRDWARAEGMSYPPLKLPEQNSINTAMLVPPTEPEEASGITPIKGPNISRLPDFEPLLDEFEAPVLLKVGDNISTDEISPAGARALPFRSNIPKLAMFSFTQIDETYPDRALETEKTGHIVVGGENYGQGSSREHAAITLRYLGLRAVIAKSFARIHWQNLANFGVLALEFIDGDDYDGVDQGDSLALTNLYEALGGTDPITVENVTKKSSFQARHRLSPRQVQYVLAGGLIPQLARADGDQAAARPRRSPSTAS